jgi:hypothetical protein
MSTSMTMTRMSTSMIMMTEGSRHVQMKILSEGERTGDCM